MNNIQVFKNEQFGSIRAVELNGEPWLVGKDVADVLGYGNYRQALKTNVDEEDKGVHQMDTLGGRQDMTIINESGLYSLKETVITHADGHTSINKTVKVTGKGQQYFINKFLGMA